MSAPVPPPGQRGPAVGQYPARSVPPTGPVGDPYVSAAGATADASGGAHTRPAADTRATFDVGDVSVGDLIGNVTRDLSTLMRQELALAQAELKQEASAAAKGAGALGGAGLAGYFVVLFLSLALWAGLSNVMDAGWAGLIVAVLWAVIAAVLYSTGRSKLRQVHPTPERTVESLSHVPDALKGSRGGNAL